MSHRVVGRSAWSTAWRDTARQVATAPLPALGCSRLGCRYVGTVPACRQPALGMAIVLPRQDLPSLVVCQRDSSCRRGMDVLARNLLCWLGDRVAARGALLGSLSSSALP